MRARVCVSVCPRGYLRNHTRDLYQIFCMLLRPICLVYCLQITNVQLPRFKKNSNKHGDKNATVTVARSSSGRMTKCQEKGSFVGCLSYWQCIVQHCIWDPYKNGWNDRDAVWDDELGSRNNVLHVTCDDPEGEGTFFGKHVPHKPTLDWSM